MRNPNVFIEERKKRVRGLLDYIGKNPDQDIEISLAKFCFVTGVRFDKAREYYNELKTAKLIPNGKTTGD